MRTRTDLRKWPSTLAFIELAPLIGMASGFSLTILIYWVFRRRTPAQMDRYFRHAQIGSAALLSCAHVTNDAQKTMGFITTVLVTGSFQRTFRVPDWVILASATAMGLGT